MKRTVLLIVLIFLLLGTLAVSAQTQDPKLYVKTVGIMKILNHALGYKVLYLKSSMEVGEFYVPHSWFKAGGKAELILGNGPAYPYFSVFYREGKFDHIKLYAPENIQHLAWGRLKRQAGDSSKFEVETLDLEF
ncbi:MAG: hypothetical protein JSV89_11515 [Spirochaetaceae bacterium]|nr:MAG: hypothetical protein JSV89_11515 [Spirochaetaceae bacterium]